VVRVIPVVVMGMMGVVPAIRVRLQHVKNAVVDGAQDGGKAERRIDTGEEVGTEKLDHDDKGDNRNQGVGQL
jgi:hypothetical protein